MTFELEPPDVGPAYFQGGHRWQYRGGRAVHLAGCPCWQDIVRQDERRQPGSPRLVRLAVGRRNGNTAWRRLWGAWS